MKILNYLYQAISDSYNYSNDTYILVKKFGKEAVEKALRDGLIRIVRNDYQLTNKGYSLVLRKK